MRTQSIRPQRLVCQFSEFISARQSNSLRPLQRIPFRNNRPFTTQSRKAQKPRATNNHSPDAEKARVAAVQAEVPADPSSGLTQAQLDEKLGLIQHLHDNILSTPTVPTAQAVEEVLGHCEALAEDLTKGLKKGNSAVSSLLSIDEVVATKSLPSILKRSPEVQKAADQLSDLAYSIVEHPPVFITPNILRKYVDLQARLRKPESFPEVFTLYATKPVPEEGSSPIKYLKPNPNKVANAVPPGVADRALNTAIQNKQLTVAMDIIDTTYNTKAFRRAKFVRKGLVPAIGLGVAPLAAYALASQLSLYQSTMDNGVATNVAFVGILAYLGFTATIGAVAVSTANDQMERITWAQGLPLRERWIREEERAAVDRVAAAWGFREVWRRGEEEGEDWEALREWAGRRMMYLDKTDLMEGME